MFQSTAPDHAVEPTRPGPSYSFCSFSAKLSTEYRSGLGVHWVINLIDEDCLQWPQCWSSLRDVSAMSPNTTKLLHHNLIIRLKFADHLSTSKYVVYSIIVIYAEIFEISAVMVYTAGMILKSHSRSLVMPLFDSQDTISYTSGSS